MCLRKNVTLFTARCYAERGDATLSKSSARQSAYLWRSGMFFTQVGILIISRPNSLSYVLLLTPTWAIWSDEHTPKLWWNTGGVMSTKKPTMSLKRCNIGPKLLWRTNRKSHTRFRLVPKSMTLDDLERTKRHSCRNTFLQSPQKNERR